MRLDCLHHYTAEYQTHHRIISKKHEQSRCILSFLHVIPVLPLSESNCSWHGLFDAWLMMLVCLTHVWLSSILLLNLPGTRMMGS